MLINIFNSQPSTGRSPSRSAETPHNGIYLFDTEIIIPFRQKGIGSRFLYGICTTLTQKHHNAVISCLVHQCNHASQRMLLKAGFIPTDE